MIFVDSLPVEIKEKLVCDSCSNLLSVTGTTVSEDAVYVCGRCSDNGTCLPASAYEALASVAKFPCKNMPYGCRKQLSWGSVMDHEKACNYRVFNCVKANCNWESNITDMQSHIVNNHNTLILRRCFFKLCNDSTEMLNIIVACNEIFMVEHKYTSDENLLYMNLIYLGKPSESGRFSFDVKIQSGAPKRLNSVIVYTGKVRALRYCRNSREIRDVKIDLNSFKNIPKSPNMKCFINITEKIAKKSKTEKAFVVERRSDDVITANTNKKDILPIQQIKTNTAVKEKAISSLHQNSQSNIFRELECPVCQEYLLPPIFVCILGHSICADCKSKLTKCPTCSSTYGNARNYTLENMIQLINFPCQNELHGCKFAGNAMKMQKHKIICKFEYIKCPMLQNCNWKGTLELLHTHLAGHSFEDTFLKLGEIATYDLKLHETCHNLVSFNDSLLRISCKHSKQANGLMRWSFQKILPKVCSTIYKIEIEFIDQTNNNRRFIIDDIFKDAMDKKNIFSENLAVPLALLQPYISSTKFLHFKYKIQ